jgi:hypothetical protein
MRSPRGPYSKVAISGLADPMVAVFVQDVFLFHVFSFVLVLLPHYLHGLGTVAYLRLV